MSRTRDGVGDPRRDVADAILAGRVSRSAAARALGVSAWTVREWVRRAARERRDAAASRFVAVRVADEAPPPRPAVEVVLAGGRVLRVASGFDAQEVARLARSLESC